MFLSQSNRMSQVRVATIEILEERQLLSLIGVMPQFPVVSYDSTGLLAYHADTGVLDIQATALTFKQSVSAMPKSIIDAIDGLQIHLLVDSAGNLLGGVPGAAADLSITGTVIERGGAVFASGVLLTGRIEKFGFLDTGTATDNFDFQFAVTGGAMASLYAGMDLGVVLGSETSTFVGSFASDFTGHAKGNVGAVAPLFPPALPASVSGFVYVDADNDGAMDSGEVPIPGATVALTGTNDLGQPVSLTTVTDSTGAYSFADLRPGTYSLIETQPAGYLDGKDSIGTQGGTAANDLFTDVVLASGQDGVNNNFGELLPASIAGNVYYDANDNGVFDVLESGIAGVQIALTGTDDLGLSVSLTATTDSAGAYIFADLRPGTYSLTETQPADYLDGKDTIGNLGGVAGNDTFATIPVGSGDAGTQYNFGELKSSMPLTCGMTATIGFWNNKNGQALIKSLNGSSTSTALGNWLATTLPNLYGSQAGAGRNLAGKTNAQIAAYFQTLFKVKGQKLDAQVLAVALAVYSTDTDLAGTAAVKYGFSVSSSGTGAAMLSVGTNGSAFGVPNYTQISVMSALQAANNQAVSGSLYGGSTSLRNMANTIFDYINNTGDIV